MYELCSQTLIMYVGYLSVQWYLEDMKLILVIKLPWLLTTTISTYVC